MDGGCSLMYAHEFCQIAHFDNLGGKVRKAPKLHVGTEARVAGKSVNEEGCEGKEEKRQRNG